MFKSLVCAYTPAPVGHRRVHTREKSGSRPELTMCGGQLTVCHLPTAASMMACKTLVHMGPMAGEQKVRWGPGRVGITVRWGPGLVGSINVWTIDSANGTRPTTHLSSVYVYRVGLQRAKAGDTKSTAAMSGDAHGCALSQIESVPPVLPRGG